MDEPDIICESCDRTEDISFCEGCNSYYCEECWDRRRSHRENRVGPNGIPHSRVNPDIVSHVKKTMAEPADDTEEKAQHTEDSETLWFGLDKDSDGDPVLAEYRRFLSVMMESATDATGPRYPGLVSFVGQTNSGKSTLIRLLLNLQGGNYHLAAPVIGRSNIEVPTSADVHLYLNPGSEPHRPILFADCEGFAGGERDPRGISDKPPEDHATAYHGSTPMSRVMNFTKRALKWASRNNSNHEVTGKRQYAITEMYPRIFHVFSDVLVFVLENPNIMEGVVEDLLRWADANDSASINRPRKPYAIIALNKLSPSGPEGQWNVFQATEQFFKSMNPQLYKNKTLQRYMAKFSRTRTITSIRELFDCYYSGVWVVRIPDKSRYHLLHEQGHQLQKIILECCEESYNAKKQKKMLPDVDQFQTYLSIAFDHFASTLDEPFDYIKASMLHRPPPQNISDTLRVFADLVGEKADRKGEIEYLFATMTNLVASCIMVDSTRKKRFGNPQDWFTVPASASSEAINIPEARRRNVWKTSYEEICMSAIHDFFRFHVRCGYIKPKSILEPGFHCAGYKETHGDFHFRDGLIGNYGDYPGDFKGPAGFDIVWFGWAERVRERLLLVYQEYEGADPRAARVHAHSKVLRDFYKPHLKSGFFNNSICLACLFNEAQYTLNCGHVICRDCVMDFGRSVDGYRVVLGSCPLSCDSASFREITDALPIPTTIQFEPAHSGLRVLTLDGGGIRGIIELAILKKIEDRIGIPLQQFFDLVVGTSTGGIVSLGFGHSQWSLADCIEKFQHLVTKAFTKRRGQGLLGIRHVELLVKKSRYESRPLEEALKEAFGTSPLFGPSQEVDDASVTASRLKVAVLTTKGSGTEAQILSNYNVAQTQAPVLGAHKPAAVVYTRFRVMDRGEEISVSDAARVTSAAPGYFKPFQHNKQFLLDGAILHNNPIEVAMAEARSIAAANNQCQTPDLVLSLGTGLQKDYKYKDQESHPAATELLTKIPVKRPKLYFVKMMFTMIKYQVELNTDAELRWKEWLGKVKDERLDSRLFRINPDLGGAPPLLDDHSQVKPLLWKVSGWIDDTPEEVRNVEEIACRLVASSFYFERAGGPRKSAAPGSLLELDGRICCRLPNDSNYIRRLGMYLTSSPSSPAIYEMPPMYEIPRKPTADPGVCFVIVNRDCEDQVLPLPTTSMLNDGHYRDVPITITIPDDEDRLTRIAIALRGPGGHRQLYQISGFPRCLTKNDYR